jgi:hypothetical protein
MGGVYCEDCDIAELVPNDSPSFSGVRHWAVDQPTAKVLWVLSEHLTDLKWLDGVAEHLADGPLVHADAATTPPVREEQP